MSDEEEFLEDIVNYDQKNQMEGLLANLKTLQQQSHSAQSSEEESGMS